MTIFSGWRGLKIIGGDLRASAVTHQQAPTRLERSGGLTYEQAVEVVERMVRPACGSVVPGLTISGQPLACTLDPHDGDRHHCDSPVRATWRKTGSAYLFISQTDVLP